MSSERQVLGGGGRWRVHRRRMRQVAGHRCHLSASCACRIALRQREHRGGVQAALVVARDHVEIGARDPVARALSPPSGASPRAAAGRPDRRRDPPARRARRRRRPATRRAARRSLMPPSRRRSAASRASGAIARGQQHRLARAASRGARGNSRRCRHVRVARATDRSWPSPSKSTAKLAIAAGHELRHAHRAGERALGRRAATSPARARAAGIRLQLAAEERRAARIVERERGERVEHAVAAGVAAVVRLDADDRDDDLRRHAVLRLGARERRPRWRARTRRRRRRAPATGTAARTRTTSGGSSSGRSIAATIFGWNFAAANQRSTSRGAKPVSVGHLRRERAHVGALRVAAAQRCGRLRRRGDRRLRRAAQPSSANRAQCAERHANASRTRNRRAPMVSSRRVALSEPPAARRRPTSMHKFYPFARPFLFALDPETAHDMAFAGLDRAARVGLAQVARAAPAARRRSR